MLKKINKADQLPKWFSIEPYLKWRDENPKEATRAIDDHFGFLEAVLIHSPLIESDIRVGMEWLQRGSREPWKRFGVEPGAEMLMARQDAYLKQEGCLEEFDRAAADKEEEIIDSEGGRIAREIAGEHYNSGKEEVYRVNLWDVMEFIKQNEQMIAEVDEAAFLFAEKHGLGFEDIKGAAYRHISLRNPVDGSDGIWLDSYPTAEVVSQKVKRFLLKNHSGLEMLLPRVGPAEVRKLFDYRVAAYIDLKIWEVLTNSSITNKCMAKALFPEGEYGPGDLSPTRTLGNFLNRMIYERGYLQSLLAKAELMGTIDDL